ncbi:MAG: site-2 protease family protein [Candidatus Jordarchaeales archaeon]
MKIFAAPPFDFDLISSLVASEFAVSDAFLDEEGTPTFILPPDQETKKPFKRLLEKLRLYNLLAVMRYASLDAAYVSLSEGDYPKTEKVIVLKVFPMEERKRRSPLINAALLAVTTLTIMMAGYNFANEFNNSLFLLSLFGLPPMYYYQPPLIHAIYYTLAIYGIIGLHEMAHYFVSKVRGVKATLPYFIPGWPFGTFGALIMQETPVANRDELFDVGISGPLTSLVIAVIATIAGILIAPVIPWPVVYEMERLSREIQVQLLSPLPTPILYELIRGLVPKPVYGVDLLNPLLWASWAGMLIVALNLFPIGQLDGGHCARAVLGMRAHYIASIISAVVMALLGYFPMALLALLLSIRGHPGPLDDVSKVTTSRKIGFIACIILAILCIPPLTFSLF